MRAHFDRSHDIGPDPAPGPSAEPSHQRARGEGALTTRLRDGRTHIGRLYQEGSAKLRFPNTHGPHLEAVLINTAGGLTGGDDLRWSAEAAPGTRLTLTTQACERIYRSLGPFAEVRTRLTVAAGAHLDWLPQETILFESSRLRRSLEIDLAPGASLCAMEAVLLGRDAMGETARAAQLRDSWRISQNGRLVHAEATRLTGAEEERDAPSLLAGARAFATLLYIGPEAERKQADVAMPVARGRAGASRMGDRLVVRVLADSGLDLRRLIIPILSKLAGAGALPRLWHL